MDVTCSFECWVLPGLPSRTNKREGEDPCLDPVALAWPPSLLLDSVLVIAKMLVSLRPALWLPHMGRLPRHG